ncbi:MAG: heme-binding protein [Chroococcidiopsidaceae cyanobacterium CP_BM_RX_35]|nr:heme-binding protein [Chroococcidiopsidaceae cyanobacterium CP_BM_RX_35]
MKFQNLLLLLGILAIPVVLIGVYRAVSAPLPAGFPPPTRLGKIEVKHYPGYRSGTFTYNGQLSQATSVAFEPLYRHISSNNIAMTAPVETRYPLITWQEGRSGKPDERGQAEVSFLYHDTDIHPQQIAPGIKVKYHAPMTVVSIGIQGAYSYESYQQNLDLLRSWLTQHPSYKVAGPPRRFFYDSPFIPDALKRSEVQIPINSSS